MSVILSQNDFDTKNGSNLNQISRLDRFNLHIQGIYDDFEFYMLVTAANVIDRLILWKVCLMGYFSKGVLQ